MSIPTDAQIKELHEKLEQKGEIKVRQELSQGIYADANKRMVENWLEQKDRDKRDKQFQLEKEERQKQFELEQEKFKQNRWAIYGTWFAAVASWAAVFLNYYLIKHS